MNDLYVFEKRDERVADDLVDALGAERSPGDVHEGQRRIELEAGDRARARAGAELGAKRVAGHGDARRRERIGAAGKT